MMKKSTLIAVFALLWFSAIVHGQETETRDLPSFNRLSVGESIHVYLIPGSKESARIKASGIDLDEVLTEVSGERLKIHLDKNNHRNVKIEVRLTYRNLERIEVSSAASIYTDGILRSESLDVEASSAGDGDLEIDVNNLEVNVSSSANLKIRGKALVQDVSVSSAGDYSAYDLKCEEAEVSVSSAGSAKVFASKRIEAKASSAGSIRYSGNPDKVYEDESSGGSVKSSN